MTTIAFKDGVMAADTQGTDYNTTILVQKIWRLPDGGVVGMCGSCARGWAGVKYLLEGEQGDPPKIAGATLLVARPDGSLWVAEDQFPLFPTLDREAVHGCGRDFARAALAEGKSAVEAVFAAIRHDILTNAPVMSLQVVPREFPEAEVHYEPPGTKPEKVKRARTNRR